MNYPCSCGKNGHLEGVAAGCGIEQVYKSKTGIDLAGATFKINKKITQNTKI